MSADINSTELTPRQAGTNIQINEALALRGLLIGTWPGNKDYHVIVLPKNNNSSFCILVFSKYYQTPTFPHWCPTPAAQRRF